MTDNQTKPEALPTTAVNASPSVLSDLLESDDLLANEILSLIGGLEHYTNHRHHTSKNFSLSLEDANEPGLLSKIIDGIIRFLVRMAKDIENGTVGISLTLGRLLDRAETINTSSRSVRRTNKSTKFDITTRIQNLSVNYRVVNDPQRLLMYLKSVDQIVRKFYQYQNDSLVNVIPGLTTIRPSDVDSVERMVSLLEPVSPVSFAKTSGFSDRGFRKDGPHLLGNQQLIVIDKNVSSEGIERLVGQEFVLQPSDDEPKGPPAKITFDSFARTTEQSILRQVIATLTDLNAKISVLSRNRRTSRVESLVSYLERLRREVDNQVYQGDSLDRANKIIQLVETYNNWLVNPYLGLLALTCRNMSAILNVCDANN